MSLKDFMLGYRPGRVIAPGEPIVQGATDTMLDGPPGSLDKEHLRLLAGLPPTGDELVNALVGEFEVGSRVWARRLPAPFGAKCTDSSIPMTSRYGFPGNKSLRSRRPTSRSC